MLGSVSQAQPLFEDRKKFTLMADPLLGDNFPVKGLFKALAVAAMCLQEEADTRPLMGDVVAALEHLTKPKDDENDAPATGETVIIAGHVESFRAGSVQKISITNITTETGYPEKLD